MRAYEWKSALILTLLVMILMRLVWMDLRSYVVSYGPQNRYALEQSERIAPCTRSLEKRLALQLGEQLLPRPGWAHAWAYHTMMHLSCRNGVFSVAGFIRYNQGLLITSVLILLLLTRIMTHSWIIGLMVAVSLLSRGRLIASLGQIGADQLIGLGLAIWGLSLAHWLRSGSFWLLGLHYASIFWLVPLEPGLIFLAGVLPLLLALSDWRGGLVEEAKLIHSGTNHDSRSMRLAHLWPWRDLLQSYKAASPAAAATMPMKGGIFRPVRGGGGVGALWQLSKFSRQTWALALWGLVIAFAEFFLLTLLRSDPILPRGYTWSFAEIQNWLGVWLQPLDRDFSLGLLLMLLAVFLKTPWLLGLRPLIMASFLGLACSTVGSLIGDLLFLPGSASRLWMGPRLLLWWEPLFLTLGLLALYQLILELIPRYGPQRQTLAKIWHFHDKA